MYRVVAVLGSALALAACSSTSMNLDMFKPAPLLDSVRLESEPPGAEAKSSNGQTCVTPCALALPTDAPLTVTFSLNGYLPDTESLEVIQETGTPPKLRPNPIVVELAAAPPPPPAKKPAKKKRVAAKKPAAKPVVRQTAAAPAPASTMSPPAQQQAPSPWPAPPPPQR